MPTLIGEIGAGVGAHRSFLPPKPAILPTREGPMHGCHSSTRLSHRIVNRRRPLSVFLLRDLPCMRALRQLPCQGRNSLKIQQQCRNPSTICSEFEMDHPLSEPVPRIQKAGRSTRRARCCCGVRPASPTFGSPGAAMPISRGLPGHLLGAASGEADWHRDCHMAPAKLCSEAGG